MTWSRPGTWSWPFDSPFTWRCEFMALWTVYEMACFFVSSDGYVPVNMPHKFQHSVQMTVVVPRLQFIDRVGHCSYFTVTGISLVQTVQKTSEIPLCSSLARLLSSRCCTTIGAGVRTVLSHGGAAIVVHRQSSTSVLWWSRQCTLSCCRCSFSTVVDIPTVAQRQDCGLQIARKPSTFHGCSF